MLTIKLNDHLCKWYAFTLERMINQIFIGACAINLSYWMCYHSRQTTSTQIVQDFPMTSLEIYSYNPYSGCYRKTKAFGKLAWYIPLDRLEFTCIWLSFYFSKIPSLYLFNPYEANIWFMLHWKSIDWFLYECSIYTALI